MKLLIVDDDFQIREGIKYAVDWEALGVDAVDTAANGLEALDIIKASMPDIILADIQMPGMTGLEMVKKIREENTDCRIIFISAYSQFEYVREALLLGANDYILKPIQMRALEELMGKTVKELTESRQVSERSRDVALQRECRSVYETREKKDGRGIRDLLKKDHPFLEKDFLITAVLKLGNEKMFPEGSGLFNRGSSRNTGLSSCYQMVKGLWKNEGDALVLLPPVADTLIVLAGGSNSALETVHYQTNLKALLDLAVRTLKETGYTVAAGISCSYGIDDLYGGYQAVLDATDLVFYCPDRTFFLQGEQELLPSVPAAVREDMAAILAMEKQSVDMVPRIRNAFLRLEEDIRKAPVKPGILGSELIRSIWKKGSTDTEAFETLVRKTDAAASLKDFLTELESYFSASQDLGMKNYKIKELSHRIRLAVSYINEHYTDVISVAEASSVAGMSPNHFSSLFKKEMGVSMSDYAMGLRLEKARKLALYSNKKVNEISEACGFTDYKYFSRIFRQKFGCAVSDMRKRDPSGDATS